MTTRRSVMSLPVVTGRGRSVPMDRALRRDLRIMGTFIGIYCRHKHRGRPKTAAHLKTYDVERIVGRPLRLCPECDKLLAHAFTKRTHCPFDPKPACKHCSEHCYHPTWRAKVKEVMRYSGTRIVLTGRIDYLFHLLF